jgi:hypothetical protein
MIVIIAYSPDNRQVELLPIPDGEIWQLDPLIFCEGVTFQIGYEKEKKEMKR